MPQITLELNNSEDESLLLTPLQRFGIRYSIFKQEPAETKNLDYYRQIVEQGISTDNFENFIEDFEQSHQDRALPFRHK